MSFRWELDARAEAEGIVAAVDVSRHARQVGLDGATFVSRGLWVRFVGAGPGQTDRLLETLAAVGKKMLDPSQASEDGTAVRFPLRAGRAASDADVISISNAEQNSLVLMLWREFSDGHAKPSLRVRVVAEDDTRAQA
jgi:hypothetical protein